MTTDTIAAVATALSNSGIGIIRVSGNDAVPIVNTLFKYIISCFVQKGRTFKTVYAKKLLLVFQSS